MRIVAPLAALAVAAGGCAGGSDGSAGSAASDGSDRRPGARSAAPSTPASPPPAPNAPLPRDPRALATDLERTVAALGPAVDDWVRRGDRGPPPEPVVLAALHEQRIYRAMAKDRALGRRTLDRLPAPAAARARDNVTATGRLLELARPEKDPGKVSTQRPPPAGELLGHFKQAGRRFGIDWRLLAAIMLVETKFGRVRSPSWAGAHGPMQFLPATWRAYGMNGDVNDPRDAVLGAANYLRASGAPRNYRRAVHAYNPTPLYVDAVLRHARQMRRDLRVYYAYYNWQVFVVTTRGDLRITGPAARRP